MIAEKEDDHHREEAFPPDDSSWAFDARIRNKPKPGNQSSTNKYGERSQSLTRLDHLSTEETITFHSDSHDSSQDRSTRLFSNNSTLFSDCFAKQIDLEDRWVTKRNERVGGKSRLVQDRQQALQEKWAQDRQVVHKKKVQWTTLNGGYKKKIVLTEEEEI